MPAGLLELWWKKVHSNNDETPDDINDYIPDYDNDERLWLWWEMDMAQMRCYLYRLGY